MLPMPKWSWTEHDVGAALCVTEKSDTLTVVYYPFDSWDDPARQAAHLADAVRARLG
jgi:hypothetical protein